MCVIIYATITSEDFTVRVGWDSFSMTTMRPALVRAYYSDPEARSFYHQFCNNNITHNTFRITWLVLSVNRQNIRK
jgi:hypothetical protein